MVSMPKWYMFLNPRSRTHAMFLLFHPTVKGSPESRPHSKTEEADATSEGKSGKEFVSLFNHKR
jgi:hypothetical protein